MEWKNSKSEALAHAANKLGVVFGVWTLESRFGQEQQWCALPVVSGMLLTNHPRRGHAGPVLTGGMRTGRWLHGTELPRINWNVREVEPSRCRPNVFRNGTYIALICQGEGRMWHVEALIAEVAKRSGTTNKTDWNYVGGRAVVRTLGRVAKVQEVLRLLWPQFAERFKNAQMQIQEAQ